MHENDSQKKKPSQDVVRTIKVSETTGSKKSISNLDPISEILKANRANLDFFKTPRYLDLASDITKSHRDMMTSLSKPSYLDSISELAKSNRDTLALFTKPSHLETASEISKAFSSNLDTFKTQRYLDLTTSIAKIHTDMVSFSSPKYQDLFSDVTKNHKLFMTESIKIDFTSNFKNLFNTSDVSSFYTDPFRHYIGSSIAVSDLFRQPSYIASSNVQFLSTSVNKLFDLDNTLTSTKVGFEPPHFSNLWETLKVQSDLNWEPIINLSARASGLSALQQLPTIQDIAQPSNKEADEEVRQVISLDEAREAVYNSIALGGAEMSPHLLHAYRFICSVEIEMRRFIHNVMTTAFGPNWEKQQLPSKMYNDWIEKKGYAVKNGHASSAELIEFADFTDYGTVIVNKKNWKVFEPFFKNKLITQTSFQRLFPYRINIMHSRPFAKGELIIIAGDCEWLLQRLNSSLIGDSGNESN